MTPGDDGQKDTPQLNRPLIQQAAALILALRWVADALAAFLLLFCYSTGELPGAALVIKAVFGAHAVFSFVSYRRYRSGEFSAGLVNADVLATTCTMLVGAHYAEGIYSPILYLLLVEIASFVVLFGSAPGRTAAIVAASGIMLQAIGDAAGMWAAAGSVQAGFSLPRVLDFATIMAASALLLIGITRTLRWAGAKEQGLRVETARAQAAASFQTALAELALASLTQEGLEPTLGLLCQRARALLESDVAMICLRDGGTLNSRAVAPALGGMSWTASPDDGSATATAARERRVVIGGTDGAGVPPAFAAHGVRRVLALPLMGHSGRVLGTLTCGDQGRARDLGTWQVRAELLGALASAAVERAHLVGSLQEEADRVRALLRVSEELGQWNSYRELVVNVCRLTRELLGADYATVRRWDDGDGVAGTARGATPSVAMEEWSRLADAAHAGTETSNAADGNARQEGREIVAPLAHAGRVYGVLTAGRSALSGAFDARQIALLEGIARQVGLALDNLRLLEDERHAATLSTTLLEVAREFNLALELSTLLSRLSAHAVDLTGASAALVALWRPRDRVYRVDIMHGPNVTSELPVDIELGSDAYHPGPEGVRLDAAWHTRFASSLGVTGLVTDVSVVLERGGEIAGILTLFWGAGKQPTQRQLALARGLANQAVIALQNVRLLEDLREASRLKSEFVATMSHELRTPLNVIMGYTNLFLEEAFGPLTERQRGVLGRMQRSASELFDLVTATLDLNRLEAGKSRVRVEPLQVPELFSQLEAETTTRLDHDNLELKWEAAPDLPAMQTDRAKLRIVLKNLVGNAIKFTEKGTVTVRAEPGSDGTVVFTVADTGIGIRSQDLPVIFDMFRQVEAASTRKHGGVGLGLYIVKRLLTELRGEVEVHSEYGVGTCFRIRVPVALPASETVPVAAAS